MLREWGVESGECTATEAGNRNATKVSGEVTVSKSGIVECLMWLDRRDAKSIPFFPLPSCLECLRDARKWSVQLSQFRHLVT